MVEQAGLVDTSVRVHWIVRKWVIGLQKGVLSCTLF